MAQNDEHEKTVLEGVELTSPDRILYPDAAITKRDIATYYIRVGTLILPHVAGRPLTLVRCPRGADEDCFYQRNYTDTLPEPVEGIELTENDGEKATYILIRDLAGLVALVQAGVLEIHPWGSRADKLENPDQVIFDLDPGPGAPWPAVIETAQLLKSRLEALGLRSFVKTSGGKGLHVVLPLVRRNTWEEVSSFAEALAKRIAAEQPDRYTATASKEERQGKIFIDWLRNNRSSTSVAPYSTRARPGAPVSAPLHWDELKDLRGANVYTVENLAQRLADLGGEVWEDFFDQRQSITQEMQREIGGGA